MKRGGGKAKGASYERQTCKALSLWVSGGKREDLFWRSAMSGGRATVGRKRGADMAQHAGDISATHEDGHKLTNYWYVECKRYNDLQIQSALLTREGKLAAFWKIACEDATSHKKLPMLIVREDRGETLLIVPLASHLTPSGLAVFKHQAMLLRSHVLRADFYLFDSVMASEFNYAQKDYDTPFLQPGELARILGFKEVKKASRKRVRIKS